MRIIQIIYNRLNFFWKAQRFELLEDVWLAQIIWGFMDPKTFKSQVELLDHWNEATGPWMTYMKSWENISIFSQYNFFCNQLVLDQIRESQENISPPLFFDKILCNFWLSKYNFLLHRSLNSASQFKLTCFSRIWKKPRFMSFKGKCVGGVPGNYMLEKLWDLTHYDKWQCYAIH